MFSQNRMTSGLIIKVDRLSRVELFTYPLIICIHAYALVVFGATYWIDSRDYISLATAMSSPSGLQLFYQTTGQWIFSHLGPGVPGAWLLLSELPVSWQWPALAIFQHMVAAGALIFAFRTVYRLWPSPVHMIFVLLLLLLPAYQAFHNSLLTESCTSSFVLIGFSCCLRIARGNRSVGSCVVVALIVIACVTQFRSYWGAIVALMLFYALISRAFLISRWMVVLFAVSAGSVLAFPTYRYLQDGQFFLPAGGINLLISASQANPHPSSTVNTLLNVAGFPDTLTHSGITMSDALLIAEKWRAEGRSNSEINEKAEELASALRSDGASVQLNRFLYGMASIGAILPSAVVPQTHEVFPGYSPRNFLDHLYGYYRWQSWASSEDYRSGFDRFFGPQAASDAAVFPFAVLSNAKIYAAFNPYISTFGVALRDPIKIGVLPPDLWLLLALLAAAFLTVQAKEVTILLLCSLAPAFAVAYAFPLGNPRYSVPLLPLYFFVISIGAAHLIARSRLSRVHQRRAAKISSHVN
ncbi:hypothetical protein AMK06_CH00815 [Rhizobium sp. N541]|uniref:hypothetical protein n=1 Tax=unclassified Rhizobium TaxID=2613769 RepID=UPI0007EE4D9A|nr:MULTISPECIES: hypothetical protein [unclassified Rhizobium]ANM15754.1 hypothetical protein AMK06_CH00815 [Rhizobium sp. N541]ANM22142.1 hypothetical protein AMK07_CH00815 [Rhizobium sp. N941]